MSHDEIFLFLSLREQYRVYAFVNLVVPYCQNGPTGKSTTQHLASSQHLVFWQSWCTWGLPTEEWLCLIYPQVLTAFIWQRLLSDSRKHLHQLHFMSLCISSVRVCVHPSGIYREPWHLQGCWATRTSRLQSRLVKVSQTARTHTHTLARRGTHTLQACNR